MNGNDELPAGHFWDPEEAKREYYKVETGLDEAKEKLWQAQARLQTVRAVHDCFLATPSIVVFEPRSIDLDHLNVALNPYWLPEGGKFEANYMNDYRITHAPWHGYLVVQKVESETIRDEKVYYGREKKRDRAYVSCWKKYSYEKRMEWYTPTGDVGMSVMERSLRTAAYPFLSQNSLYDKLMDEVKQEVYTLLAPLSRQVVLKFIPDLAPSNIDEIYLSHGIYKEDVPSLSWPALVRYTAPKTGERYGLASYKGICWINCGQWEPYQFPKATLQAMREQIARIFDRLRERITDAVWVVVAVEEEIAALRRRQNKIRTLHYKPLVYREFWSAMQTTERQDFD